MNEKPPPLPQLVMWYPQGSSSMAEGELAAGYALRTYRDGDQQGWCDLLNANAELGAWSLERVEGELNGKLVREGQIFACKGEEIVASAGVYDRQREGREAWEIGWVATHPDHQGKGLGRAVTGGAVKVARSLPERPIYLLTDDFRISALKVYLRLGFVPDLEHPSYVDRWEKIFAQLGASFAEYRSLMTRSRG